MPQSNNNTIDELLAPSGVEVTATNIRVGDRLGRTLFVASYPRYVDAGWLSRIINLDRKFNISIYLHPKDSGKLLKDLRSQLGKLEAQVIEEQSEGKVRNPLLETAIGDIEMLRDKMQQGTERFFEMGVYITLYGKDKEELDYAENDIRAILDSQLVYTKRAVFRMEEGFKTSLPLVSDQLDVHTSANTGPVATLFPFVSHNLTSDEGILYGVSLHNSSLVLFDRFKLENANTVVFGKSGGGKSYAVKLEILRSLIFGTQIYVIDPENEYKFLAESIGGSSVNISISSEHHINPFDIPRPQEDETFEDVLRSHITNLVGFFKLLLGKITPEEDAMLDEAIRQTYASKDISPQKEPSEDQIPVMSDFENILQGMQGTASLATRIKRYTSGTFSGFLNNPTNVILDNQFVVFSIRDMEEELRPAAMYLVLNHIWTQVRTELKKRILVIDEAWWLVKHPFGGEFLVNMAKRARKHYLGLTTITQDIDDFMRSEYGRPIVTNSSLQLLLRQSPASIDIVQETFNLTDSEKFFLLEAAVGHGLFFAGNNHIAMRVVRAFSEDQVITSDPKQLLEIQEARRAMTQQQ